MKDYAGNNRLRLIVTEQRVDDRRQRREAVLRVLSYPIINLAIFLTSMILMSSNVQAMMLGDAGSDAMVFIGCVGMLYAIIRLGPARSTRHRFYQGTLLGGKAGW